MRKSGCKGSSTAVACICIMGVLAIGAVLCEQYVQSRGHGEAVIRMNTFTESSRKLNNPYRGFFSMQGFYITEEAMDVQEAVEERLRDNVEERLVLVQINLQQFAGGEISEQGLINVDKLFQAFEQMDKHLIVRFVYDWEGENARVEPDHLDVILGHMQQLEGILRKYNERIFAVQGLFVGNWGEMNGSKFLEAEDIQTLAAQLAAVTDCNTFLAVRTPAQWRSITRLADGGGVSAFDGSLPARLGLYNDGMLGNESDCGTYGNVGKEQGFCYKWNRAEELVFQEELCERVPLGGEVIMDNSYNDFENAVADMAVTHVTYLNGEYDAEVLKKWENTIVTKEGCYQGMDGLTYVERHLGYRLVLGDVKMKYDFRKDSLNVKVSVRNVGFAPMYREADVSILLMAEDGTRWSNSLIPDETVRSGGGVAAQQDIRSLVGGSRAEEQMLLKETFSLKGLREGRYQLYLQVTDVLSGEQITFGNEQDMEKYGYCLGEVELLTMGETFQKLVGQ